MMKAIETSASFDENGHLSIDNLPPFFNQKVKLFILIEETETENDLYNLSMQGLSKSYFDEEPGYDLNSIKEPNPFYKNAAR
jgi:hypothetical protein